MSSGPRVEILQGTEWSKVYYQIVKGEFMYTTSKDGNLFHQLINEQKKLRISILFYLLKFYDEKRKELLQLRCKEYQTLQNINTDIEENNKYLQDIGRPLTVQIHETSHKSYLSVNPDKIQFRGLVNLLVLILLSYTVRAVVQSLEEHDFINDYIASGVMRDPANYQTGAALLFILTFPVISFWIELLATQQVNRKMIYFMIVTNMLVSLVFPVVASYVIKSHPLAAAVLMMFSCGQSMKLISFHHIMHDNRVLVRRLQKQQETDTSSENVFNLPQELYQEALRYPQNLNFRHFVRYMVAPTLCFQFIFPSTNERIARQAVVPIQQGNYGKLILLSLKLSVPSAYLWLIGFYAMFHCYLNMWGEITMFADRRFYSDFWNAGDLSEYWRKWNFPVHSFLIRHVYFPMRRRKVNKQLALFMTFFVSAAAHEYVIIGVFRVVNFIAFFLMIINVPIIAVQHQFKGVVSPNVNNIIYWLGYLIIGQPLGIILCYYQFNY
eukprot:403358242